jgi:hypothetical protein
MFFLSQYIQKKVGAIFFARGKSYFQNKQAELDGFVSNGVNGGTFYGIVSGTRTYELTLDLDFIE